MQKTRHSGRTGRSIIALCFASAWLGCGSSDSALVDPLSSDAGSQLPWPSDAQVLLPAVDAGPDADLQTPPSCMHVVNLTAVTIAKPEPFDVVIVADNSDSLSWSRDSLAAGLSDLLARVHGSQIRFFLLTTTQYGASSQAAVSASTGKPLVLWSDTVTGKPYAHPMTEYAQTCSDSQGAKAPCPTTPGPVDGVKIAGQWQFQMPAAIGEITPDMTDAEVALVQRKIADNVLALGGSGAQQEQPICTLSRYIAQAANQLPKHAVFVVISDEDDSSSPSQCLASYELAPQMSTGPLYESCTTGCSQYIYYASRTAQQQTAAYDCVPIDDLGHEHPEGASRHSLVVNYAAQCQIGSSATCTSDQLANAKNECGPVGFVAKNCQATCADGGSAGCSLQRSDNTVNLCQQPFDEAGMHYQNLAAYCMHTTGSAQPWQNCDVQGQRLTAQDQHWTWQKETITPLVNVPDLTALIADFKTRAQAAFGASGYSVESIILDAAFSCAVHDGQSYAPNLRQLAASANDVFPLCQDYAPALGRIRDFANALVQNDFAIALRADEHIESVKVSSRAQVQRTLAPVNYSYDRGRGVLHLNAGQLTPADVNIEVGVGTECLRLY
jgi:hypothetical protein